MCICSDSRGGRLKIQLHSEGQNKARREKDKYSGFKGDVMSGDEVEKMIL